MIRQHSSSSSEMFKRRHKTETRNYFIFSNNNILFKQLRHGKVNYTLSTVKVSIFVAFSSPSSVCFRKKKLPSTHHHGLEHNIVSHAHFHRYCISGVCRAITHGENNNELLVERFWWKLTIAKRESEGKFSIERFD